jgi:hypothetical protein
MVNLLHLVIFCIENDDKFYSSVEALTFFGVIAGNWLRFCVAFSDEATIFYTFTNEIVSNTLSSFF